MNPASCPLRLPGDSVHGTFPYVNGKPVILVFLCLITCGQQTDFAATVPKTNVLFICVDDLKPLLGCYGDKQIKSPNIDRLAQRGMLFECAYCNQAVCAPSRNSLLTGIRSTSLGIYDFGTIFRSAVPDAITLPQSFIVPGHRAEGWGKVFTEWRWDHE